MAAKEFSTKIGEALNYRIGGPVLTDEKTLNRYSTDQSMYRVRPLAAVLPQDVKTSSRRCASRGRRGYP